MIPDIKIRPSGWRSLLVVWQKLLQIEVKRDKVEEVKWLLQRAPGARRDPPRLHPSLVARSEPFGKGFLLHLSCGHTMKKQVVHRLVYCLTCRAKKGV